MQWNVFRSHIAYLSKADITRVSKAFELGAELHKDQKRRSGQLYFTHPIAVAHKLADYHADADTIIAALLHDTVEDTPITLSEIHDQFNGSVAELIDGVTKLTPEDVQGNPALDDNIETLRKLFTYLEKDVRIVIIKLADRLHNMQTVEHLSEKRQISYAQETLDVYVKIADQLSMRDLRDELENLCLSILKPDLCEKLHALDAENERLGKQIIKRITTTLDKEGVLDNKQIHFEYKSWQSLTKQAESKAGNKTMSVKLAFVCSDEQACYNLLGELHRRWKREVFSFEDFINEPRPNGYRALHTTIILEDGMRLRCKIFTQEMFNYSHRGITLFCFDNEPAGIFDYLTWVERIQTLALDTSRRSEEFWETLQSDILGKSIIIHTSGERPVSIPEGSTALDGAFYAYGERCLLVKKIFVNGQVADFFQSLHHADVLTIECTNRKTVHHDWLQFVTTGFAQAKIRKGLGKQSTSHQENIGKKMLEEEMQRSGKGFLEEFNREQIEEHLQKANLGSLKETYLALAQGYLEASFVLNALFQQNRSREKKMSYILHTTCSDKDQIPLTKYILKQSEEKITIRPKVENKKNNFEISGIIKITPKQQAIIIAHSKMFGARSISLTPYGKRNVYIALVLLLIVIWGLDPVIAHYIIAEHTIIPTDLTLVRFLSLTIFSFFIYKVKSNQSKVSKRHLSLTKASLWISVVLLIGVAFTTYQSLQGTLPTHYTIPMTAGGLVLTSIVNRHQWKILLITWCLFLSAMSILIYYSTWSLESMLYTFSAVALFSLFSMVSEQYKRQERILERSEEYFFYLSLFCTLFSLPLLAVHNLNQYHYLVLLEMVGFSILFAGMPYYLYYILLSHRQIDFVLRYSFLIIISTAIGQLLLGNSLEWYTIVSGVLVIVGAFIPIAYNALHEPHANN